MLVLAHVSSTKTTWSGSIASCSAAHPTTGLRDVFTLLARSRRASFFSRPTQGATGPAERHVGDFPAEFFLGGRLQLTQVDVGLLVQLGQDPRGMRLPRLAPIAGRLGSQLALLATLLLDATNPRFRNAEPQRNFASSSTGVTSRQHIAAKLLRIASIRPTSSWVNLIYSSTAEGAELTDDRTSYRRRTATMLADARPFSSPCCS